MVVKDATTICATQAAESAMTNLSAHYISKTHMTHSSLSGNSKGNSN